MQEAKIKANKNAEISRERHQQVEDRRKTRMAEAVRRKKELLRVTDHWMITKEREQHQEEHAKKVIFTFDLFKSLISVTRQKVSRCIYIGIQLLVFFFIRK